MRTIKKYLFCHVFISILLMPTARAQNQPQLNWKELQPVILQLKLGSLDPDTPASKEIAEIEELDSRLYGPVAGITLFLKAASPTKDSEGLRPRYWLRIEDYPTAEAAVKRASQYHTVDSYERIEKIHPYADQHMLSKLSVRLWAVARGRRVYVLTTNAYLFSLLELPNKLKKAISELPER